MVSVTVCTLAHFVPAGPDSSRGSLLQAESALPGIAVGLPVGFEDPPVPGQVLYPDPKKLFRNIIVHEAAPEDSPLIREDTHLHVVMRFRKAMPAL